MPTGYLRDPATGQWAAVEVTRELIGLDRPDWKDNTDYIYKRGSRVILATYIGAEGRQCREYTNWSGDMWAFLTRLYSVPDHCATPVIVYTVESNEMYKTFHIIPNQLFDTNPSLMLYAAIPSLLPVIQPVQTTVLHGHIGRLVMRKMNVPQFISDHVDQRYCTFAISLRRSRERIGVIGQLYINVYGKPLDQELCKDINYYGGDRVDYVRKCIREIMHDDVDRYGGCEYIVFQTNMTCMNDPRAVDLSTPCLAAFYDCMEADDVAVYESGLTLGEL